MRENSLSKAVARYAADQSQANYGKLMQEFFWTIVNNNNVYYVQYGTEMLGEDVPMPSIIEDGDGKKYAAIFSTKSDALVASGADIIAIDAEKLVKAFIMTDIQGLVLDVESGVNIVILNNYLVTMLHSVNTYRDSLGG